MAYEDFTGYTEDDTNARCTVTANKLDIDACIESDVMMVYADKGAAHFGISFTHQFELTVQAMANSRYGAVSWALAETVIDGREPWTNNLDHAVLVTARRYSTTYYRIVLQDAETGNQDTINFDFAVGTKYYITIIRSGALGVTLTAEIRTGSHTGTLQDTLVVTLTASRTYRYGFGCNNSEEADNESASWDVENLDLNEAAPPAATDMGAIDMAFVY